MFSSLLKKIKGKLRKEEDPTSVNDGIATEATTYFSTKNGASEEERTGKKLWRKEDKNIFLRQKENCEVQRGNADSKGDSGMKEKSTNDTVASEKSETARVYPDLESHQKRESFAAAWPTNFSGRQSLRSDKGKSTHLASQSKNQLYPELDRAVLQARAPNSKNQLYPELNRVAVKAQAPKIPIKKRREESVHDIGKEISCEVNNAFFSADGLQKMILKQERELHVIFGKDAWQYSKYEYDFAKELKVLRKERKPKGIVRKLQSFEEAKGEIVKVRNEINTMKEERLAKERLAQTQIKPPPERGYRGNASDMIDCD